MKKAFSVWIEVNVQKNMPLIGPLIRAKVMRIYVHLIGKCVTSTLNAGTSDVGTCSPSPFQASSGWFDHFMKRYSLRIVKLTGEYASAEHEVAETLPAQLAQLIEENGYLPEQVFQR